MVSLIQLISFKMYKEEQRAWSTHSQDRFKALGLPTLEYRRLRADVIQIYKILNQMNQVDIDKFFHCVRNDHKR